MRKISIPEGCTNIVIFVHGFGVRWDSRGMFTDLAENLPDGWGSVLFDLYDVNGGNVHILSISEQVKRVQTIYKEISELHPEATIHLIAHSMGCIVASFAELDVEGNIILLAPPDTFHDGALEEYFRHYKGAREEPTALVVPRKDGTVSHIPYTFFDEMRRTNPLEPIKKYCSKKPAILIQTTADEVIGKTDYLSLAGTADIIQISADHNFTGESREALIATITKLLS